MNSIPHAHLVPIYLLKVNKKCWLAEYKKHFCIDVINSKLCLIKGETNS